MVLYLVAPFYLRLIRRCPSWRWLPAVAMVWAVMVQYYPPVHSLVGHVEIFWSRVPIFLLGINFGSMVQEKRTLEGSALWLLLLTLALSLTMCLEFEESWRGRFPLFIIVNVQKYDLGYVLTSLITIVVSLALAFVLHHLVAFVTRFLPR